MITGDSKETAISIAKEVDLYDDDSIALSSSEIDLMSEKQLSQQLNRVR